MVKFEREGKRYHVTLHTRPADSIYAKRALRRIRAWFGGHEWRGVIGIERVALPGHTAIVRPNGILGPVEGDILFLRGQFGRHPGPITISM